MISELRRCVSLFQSVNRSQCRGPALFKEISLFKRAVVRTCSTTSNSTNDEVCVSMSLCVHLQKRERERERERERSLHVSVYKNLHART